MRNKRAQSIGEFTMLIVAVAIAFGAMVYYARRAVQGNFKLIEDQINYGTFDDEPESD